MTKVIFTLICVAFISACAGSPVQTRQEAEINRKAMFNLNIGMTKDNVLNIMGQPRKSEVYSKNGKSIEFWLYMTEGVTTDDRRLRDSNFTPIAFENGRVTGWGRNFYDETIKYEHKIEIK